MPFVEEQTRPSIKNILLATVFTEPSEAILSYVVGLARRYTSKMSLTRSAYPEAICEISRKCRADLVVVGTQSQDVRKSDVEVAVGEILRNVPCPMLIIGPGVRPTGVSIDDLERIVFVTDYTISSLKGLPYTLALSRDFGAQIRFVHVSEGPTMGPFLFGDSRTVAFRKRLENLLGAKLGLPQESEFTVQEGDRAERVVTIAARLNASLIVMSAREVPERTAPSVVSPIDTEVVCRAHSPVLIARDSPSPEKHLIRECPGEEAHVFERTSWFFYNSFPAKLVERYYCERYLERHWS